MSEPAITHIQKLAFGLKTIDALRRRIALRSKGGTAQHVVLTRMMPKRADEIAGAGSLYWVIAGQIRARQRILSMDAFGGKGGKGKRCRIVLEPVLVETECVARKAFQGWRYLESADAPRDLAALPEAPGLPPVFHRELADLGLL